MNNLNDPKYADLLLDADYQKRNGKITILDDYFASGSDMPFEAWLSGKYNDYPKTKGEMIAEMQGYKTDMYGTEYGCDAEDRKNVVYKYIEELKEENKEDINSYEMAFNGEHYEAPVEEEDINSYEMAFDMEDYLADGKGSKLLRPLKQGVLLPVRKAFILLVFLNVFNLAGKLNKLKQLSDSNPEAKKTWDRILNLLWTRRFGGDPKSLIKNIDKGSKKKPLTIKLKRKPGEKPKTVVGKQLALSKIVVQANLKYPPPRLKKEKKEAYKNYIKTKMKEAGFEYSEEEKPEKAAPPKTQAGKAVAAANKATVLAKITVQANLKYPPPRLKKEKKEAYKNYIKTKMKEAGFEYSADGNNRYYIDDVYYNLDPVTDATAAAATSTPLLVTIVEALGSVATIVGALDMDKETKDNIGGSAGDGVTTDGSTTVTSPDGTTTIMTPDGKTVIISPEGDTTAVDPKGNIIGDEGVGDGAENFFSKNKWYIIGALGIIGAIAAFFKFRKNK